MAFREVTFVGFRYLCFWRLLKTPYKGLPMTLARYVTLTDKEDRAQVLLTERRITEIPKTVFDNRGGDLAQAAAHLKPLAERGGDWWCFGGAGATDTYDNPEKNLQPGDMCIAGPRGKVMWKDADGLHEEAAADVIITRDGGVVTKIERKS